MKPFGIDIGFLTKTKFSKGYHSLRQSNGYKIYGSVPPSPHQGGVALVYRQQFPGWHIESQKVWGPNVISAEIVIKSQRRLIVGVYFSPSKDPMRICDKINAAVAHCAQLALICLAISM